MSENLKAAMATAKITQKQMAIELGIPPSTIHGWLNGVAPKNIIEVKKVATLFNLTVDELCFSHDIKKMITYPFIPEAHAIQGESVIAEIGSIEIILRKKQTTWFMTWTIRLIFILSYQSLPSTIHQDEYYFFVVSSHMAIGLRII